MLLAFQYKPFLTPLPIWDHWFWLLIPLCAAVAIVYKVTKVSEVSRVPREGAILTTWIVLAMLGAALALAVLVQSR